MFQIYYRNSIFYFVVNNDTLHEYKNKQRERKKHFDESNNPNLSNVDDY